jgi:Mpv17-like protein
MPVQYINFFLMPTSLRVVFVATTSFLWVNILCILKRKENQQQIVELN